MMKEKIYCIFQVKQDFDFNKKTNRWGEEGSTYVDLIAYGRSKKPLKDFAEIAWDLCNIFCWDDNLKQDIFDKPITRNNQDFIDPIPANFTGIVNSDIFICEKNNPKEFFVADIFNWTIKSSKKEAEEYIINNNPILKHYKEYDEK